MDREQFISQQTWVADLKLTLISSDECARECFRQLAIDTYDFFMSAGAAFVLTFDPSPESAFNALRCGGNGWAKRSTERGVQDDGHVEVSPEFVRNWENWSRPIELSPALRQRWESWNRKYFDIRARNPRLELRDMMQDISESDSASSWSYGYERHIQAWVDAGDPSAPPPFDDGYGIVKPEFFNRLRELRQLCGGWLYWNDDLNRIVFAAEPEWQRVRAAQDAVAAERRRAWEENKARSEHSARRLPEAIRIARSDKSFWQSLRTWELKREANRPSQLLAHQPLVGPTRIVTSSSEEQAPYDDPPVDPLFAEFIARVRERDNVLTVHDIVANLRREVRRELGLDDTIFI